MSQKATFIYLKASQLPKDKTPFQIFHPTADDCDPRRTNIEWEVGPEETVHDIREQQDTLLIDKQGFQIIRHLTTVEDFSDNEMIETQYLPELKIYRRKSRTQIGLSFSTGRSVHKCRISIKGEANKRYQRRAELRGNLGANPLSLPSMHPHIGRVRLLTMNLD